MALLPGAFRSFAPALALSLLDPKLTWSEAEVAASVARGVEIARADGSPLSPYDLKRLQVRSLLQDGRMVLAPHRPRRSLLLLENP